MGGVQNPGKLIFIKKKPLKISSWTTRNMKNLKKQTKKKKMRGVQNLGKLRGRGPPVDVLIKKSPEYCNKRCSTTRNMKNLKNIKRTGRGSKSGKNWVLVTSSKVF